MNLQELRVAVLKWREAASVAAYGFCERVRRVLPGERLCVSVLISVAFFFLFGTTLQAEFYVIEDHLLVTQSSYSIREWFIRASTDIPTFGRLRPIYWVLMWLRSQLLGIDPHLLHLSTLALGVFTCWMFYVAARELGFDLPSSLVFISILIVGGGQSWIWYNLVTAETLATPLFSLAVVAVPLAARHAKSGLWDVVFVAASVLAGLTKESFLLTMPSLLLLRWLMTRQFVGNGWQRSLRDLQPTVLLGGLLFVGLVVSMIGVTMLQPRNYALTVTGLSLASVDPQRWYELVTTSDLGLLLKYWVVLGVLACVIRWFDKPNDRESLWVGIAIFVIWLVPQLVLHRNGFQQYYLFPVVICLAGAIAFCLATLWKKKLWWAWVICVTWLAPLLVNGAVSASRMANWFTAETLAAHRLIQFIADNLTANQVVLLATDTATPYGYEASHSLPLYLAKAGSKSPMYVWYVATSAGQMDQYLSASRLDVRLLYPPSLTPDNVGAIILTSTHIPGLDTLPLSLWLGDTRWQEVVFVEPYSSFSLSPFGHALAGEVTYRLLVPSDDSSKTLQAPHDHPLITLDPDLVGHVRIDPLLSLPPWGPEPSTYTGDEMAIWMGQGEKQGVGGVLWAVDSYQVDLSARALLGPSTTAQQLTVELTLENSTGTYAEQREFGDGTWLFTGVSLRPGKNLFRLKIVDEPNVLELPNGDTRSLMAMVQGIAISETSPCSFAFSTGWYGQEGNGDNWWRWARDYSQLRIAAHKDVDLLLRGYLSSVSLPNEISVYLNGQEESRLHLTSPSYEVFEIGPLHLQSGEYIMEFVSNNSEVFLPTDSRLLAFSIANLLLFPVDESMSCKMH